MIDQQTPSPNAQRTVIIRAYRKAIENTATAPHLAHVTQTFRARPSASAPTLTNRRTARLCRICNKRSSDKPSISNLA